MLQIFFLTFTMIIAISQKIDSRWMSPAVVYRFQFNWASMINWSSNKILRKRSAFMTPIKEIFPLIHLTLDWMNPYFLELSVVVSIFNAIISNAAAHWRQYQSGWKKDPFLRPLLVLIFAWTENRIMEDREFPKSAFMMQIFGQAPKMTKIFMNGYFWCVLENDIKCCH